VTPAGAFRELLEALDALHIPYLVCGSLASSVHGVPRATRDIDLVAAIRIEHVDRLAAALSGHFYADPQLMREALAHNRAFNVIHLASPYKFDIFPAADDAYVQAQFERGQPRRSSVEGEEVQFQVASAEDTILAKLVWYKSGGSVSEQQWRDVVSVVEVQRGRLDLRYLHLWAAYLGVPDLMERALQ
jgi:hypothetical protein